MSDMAQFVDKQGLIPEEKLEEFNKVIKETLQALETPPRETPFSDPRFDAYDFYVHVETGIVHAFPSGHDLPSMFKKL